eukprot:SAG31_NODE_1884_length_6996_cov_4.386835_4_plen_249_part_00
MDRKQRSARAFLTHACHLQSWEEVIADPAIDAIVIGTWPYMHKTLSIAALEAGKHVLCEARMAMDAAEAHEMLAIAKRHPSLVAQIVPSPMTLKFDATIKRLLKEGTLGDVLYVDVRGLSGQSVDTEKPLHWRSSYELSGHNTMSMGIFYEAARRWVGDAVKVTAMAQTFVKTRFSPESGSVEAVKVPDHIDVLATLARGAQLHMTISDVLVGAGRPTAEFWLYGTKVSELGCLPLGFGGWMAISTWL